MTPTVTFCYKAVKVFGIGFVIVGSHGLAFETEKALTPTKAEIYRSHQGLCLSFSSFLSLFLPLQLSICLSFSSLPLLAVVFHREIT